MSTDHLLSIGGFAIVSGLSITALRHYDEVGVLLPAWVDPVTGYRRYRPEQAQQARLIRALRQLEMPVEAIRQVERTRPNRPLPLFFGSIATTWRNELRS